jgi:hypothetical protein
MTDFPLARLGPGVNYAERWDDLRVGVTSINPAGSVAPPSVNETNGTLEFSASAVNIVAVEVQLPHTWDEGTSIRPHIHWRKKTGSAGEVVWRLTSEFVNAGEVYTDTPVTVETTSTSPYGANSDTALRHLITPFGDVGMTGKRVSCVGLLTIARVGNDDADTYAGVAQLLSVDIHYRSDAMGSVGEFVKQNVEGFQP